MMDVQAYLDRIGYRGALDPTEVTLRALHSAHMMAVPFENLNIGLGWPIVLDAEALFDKIVVRRRGGFCYELNGLFSELLRELGFGVTLLSAGVARSGGGFGPDFDHLTLLVQSPPLAGDPQQATWLADVGFGDSFQEPLRFDDPGEQRQGDRAYRVAQNGERFVLEQREADGAWEPQYQFTAEPRRLAQFEDMCRYHQTSPESSFTRRRVCTRATPEGRVTLSDMRLIFTSGGERHEQPLADEVEARAALRDHFGIDYPAVV
jgi:N-hydroxyarylamine O-acetyltransferase